MISRTTKIFLCFGILVEMIAGGGTIPARAQEAVTLTITPPLVQLTIGPGEFWTSVLRVVNTNPNDLVVYATPMNFVANDDQGHGNFVPIDPRDATDSLARWLEVTSGPIVIPREETREIPFSVRIPSDAPPGGHYAAILIGTKPFGGAPTMGAQIAVSSYISTLFFVRVSGDIVESGSVREFSVDQEWYTAPQPNFTVRFENTGNVHVRPRGTITISDMWGREKAILDINQRGEFGNVLPKTTRRFETSWRAPGGIMSAGRYTAIAAFSFGEEGKKSASSTIYFWVVPIKELGLLAGGFFVFVLFLRFFVRRSVRKALRATGGEPNKSNEGDGPERHSLAKIVLVGLVPVILALVFIAMFLIFDFF